MKRSTQSVLMAWTIALAMTGPVQAERPIIDLKAGDFLCVGYDPTSHSCAQVQILRAVSRDIYSWNAVSIASDLQPHMQTLLTTKTQVIGDRHCMVAGSTSLAFDPPQHPLSHITRIVSLGIAKELEKKNACGVYRRCGGQYAGIMYLGEKRAPWIDVLFVHFEADDPAKSTLQVRPIPSAELEGLMGNVAQECLPAS